MVLNFFARCPHELRLTLDVAMEFLHPNNCSSCIGFSPFSRVSMPRRDVSPKDVACRGGMAFLSPFRCIDMSALEKLQDNFPQPKSYGLVTRRRLHAVFGAISRQATLQYLRTRIYSAQELSLVSSVVFGGETCMRVLLWDPAATAAVCPQMCLAVCSQQWPFIHAPGIGTATNIGCIITTLGNGPLERRAATSSVTSNESIAT